MLKGSCYTTCGPEKTGVKSGTCQMSGTIPRSMYAPGTKLRRRGHVERCRHTAWGLPARLRLLAYQGDSQHIH